MSRYDADVVSNKLPSVSEEELQTSRSGLVSPPSSNASTPSSERIMSVLKKVAPAAPVRTPVPAPAPATPQAKSLWGYNEDGTEPADLSFPAGVTIEILEETNADWWKGRYQGREGLLPSSYVEKLPPSTSSTGAVPSFPQASASPPSDPEKAAIYSGGHSNSNGRFAAPGPPNNHGYMPPPPQQNQWGGYSPQPPQQQWSGGGGGPPSGYFSPPPPPPPPEGGAPEKKKNKFGKYGSQAGSAAASGVGFGAGAAIGSGIVNAIF